jgi:hypothetical protein
MRRGIQNLLRCRDVIGRTCQQVGRAGDVVKIKLATQAGELAPGQPVFREDLRDRLEKPASREVDRVLVPALECLPFGKLHRVVDLVVQVDVIPDMALVDLDLDLFLDESEVLRDQLRPLFPQRRCHCHRPERRNAREGQFARFRRRLFPHEGAFPAPAPCTVTLCPCRLPAPACVSKIGRDAMVELRLLKQAPNHHKCYYTE